MKSISKILFLTITIAPQAKKCDGVPSTDASCCTSTYPCNEGEGDCDLDSDCKGNLRCGIDNCLSDFSSSGSNWSSAADCCISMKIFTRIYRYSKIFFRQNIELHLFTNEINFKKYYFLQ